MIWCYGDMMIWWYDDDCICAFMSACICIFVALSALREEEVGKVDNGWSDPLAVLTAIYAISHHAKVMRMMMMTIMMMTILVMILMIRSEGEKDSVPTHFPQDDSKPWLFRQSRRSLMISSSYIWWWVVTGDWWGFNQILWKLCWPHQFCTCGPPCSHSDIMMMMLRMMIGMMMGIISW